MFRSEPKTIVQFLATHFDLIRRLFDIQILEGVITHHQFTDALTDWDKDIEHQLFGHRIIIEQNDDYLINEPYYVLLEFILQQFKPLLPEEIEIYGQSIRTLFHQIREGIHSDKNILLERMDALSNQIKKFTTAIQNNTISLRNESRELKANTQKMEYLEKIRKARHLIDFYILPLNSILDVNHSQSIYIELLNITTYVNGKRFSYENESIRRQFEKMYNLLIHTSNDISKQSAIISNELLPLIERIRTESEYLQGFHTYLTNGNCYRTYTPPPLLSGSRIKVYQPHLYENSKEYFEQFRDERPIVIREQDVPEDRWIFDRADYKERLERDLPVDDFFTWCKEAIESDRKDLRLDEYFMVTGLIFDAEYVTEFRRQEVVQLVTAEAVLEFPCLSILKKKHVSERT